MGAVRDAHPEAAGRTGWVKTRDLLADQAHRFENFACLADDFGTRRRRHALGGTHEERVFELVADSLQQELTVGWVCPRSSAVLVTLRVA